MIFYWKKKTTYVHIMNTKKPKELQKISCYVQNYSNYLKSTMELLLVKPHAQDQSKLRYNKQ